MSDYQGMRWFKCDLHVHTPEDGRNWDPEDLLRLPTPRRPKVNGEPDSADIQDKARRFLQRCHELALEVLGVTDHNFSSATDPRDWFFTHLIEQNRTVANERGRAPLWIFPGFEIDIGYHLLCLFPSVKAGNCLSQISDILTSLGLACGSRFINGMPCPLRHDDQYVSLRTVLNKVQNECGGMVIAAHAFSNDGIANESRDAEDFLNEDLLCVEVPSFPLEGRAKEILEGRNSRWRRSNRQPAFVLSSDTKSTLTDDDGNPKANSLGYRFSWIKMSEPSIEALRQAFLDNESRIRLQPESPIRDHPHGRIVSIAVSNAAFLDDQEVDLSPNLNCIIGGRGTGKSTIVEYLRMAVRGEDDPLAQDQVQRLLKTIQPDTVITVEWEGWEGVADRFEFRPGLGKAQVVGRELADSATVFRNLDIQIFSQRQITKIAERPSFLMDLIDQLCGEDLQRLRQQEVELVERIAQVQQQKRILQRLEQEMRELEQELVELNRQWSARAAVQKEGEAHRHAQEAQRYLDRLREDVDRIAAEWNELANDLVEAHSPIGSVVKEWPHTPYFESLEQEVEKAKESLAVEIQGAVERYRARVRELTEEHDQWEAVQDSIRQAEKAFLEACARQGLQPEDVDRLRELDAQRRLKGVEVEQKNSEIERVTKAVAGFAGLLQELHDLWRKQTEVRAQCTDAILHGAGIRKVPQDSSRPRGETRPFVEVSVEYSADKSDFYDKWNTLVPDRRFRMGRSWQDIGQEVLQAFLESQRVSASPWDILERWLTDATATPESIRQHADELREHFHSQKRDEWDKTRFVRVKDGVDLTLYRSDGTVAGSLQGGGLSDGQRNTAVLSLLLAQGRGPVLIDQPEDELDSDFIFSELVPLLRNAKERRQIIAVTHNANLPVNADAELVYALETREGCGRVRCQGGLDQQDVKRAVLDIMEGSEEAFRKRWEKYRF